MAPSIRVNMAKVATMGKAEIGLKIPIRGNIKLANKPVNITKARLSPTEYTKLSIAFIL